VQSALGFFGNSQSDIKDANAARYEEYRKKLKEQEAIGKANTAQFLDSAYNKNAQPYTLKQLNAPQPVTPNGAPAPMPAQAPKPKVPGSSLGTTIGAGLLGSQAYDYFTGAADANPFIEGGESIASASPNVSGTMVQNIGDLDANVPSSFSSPPLGVIGQLAGAYGAYNDLQDWGQHTDRSFGGIATGAAKGGAEGYAIAGPPGAAVGAILGASGRIVKTGKHKDQVARDSVRDRLQQSGFLDGNWAVTTAKGNKFNLGADGGASLLNMDGKGSRPYYNTDGSNPLSSQVIPMLDPLGEIIAGGNSKLRSDFTAYLTNAALSDAKTIDEAKANVQNFYSQLGITREDMNAFISDAEAKGLIDKDRANVYRANVSQFNLPSGGGSEGTGTMPSFGGYTVNIAAPKVLPSPPPTPGPDFSLLNLAKTANDRPRADELFNQAIQGILGGKKNG
jgi:hypothetical protein